MSNLKPCPKCKGKAVIIENLGRKKNKPVKYHAACNTFGCSLYAGLPQWHDYKSEAAKAWNKYVEEDGTDE